MPLYGCAGGVRSTADGGTRSGHPTRGYWGPGLSTEDKQLLLESVARLNTAVPIEIGSSESWSNPQTNNSGRSSILRVFRSGGRICHLVRHRIVIAGRRARNYSLT
jgi:hypothetical protein